MKLVEIGSSTPVAVVEQGDVAEGAGPRIARYRSALADPSVTKFTGGGDRDTVCRMYSAFVAQVGNVMASAASALGGVEIILPSNSL